MFDIVGNDLKIGEIKNVKVGKDFSDQSRKNEFFIPEIRAIKEERIE